MKKLGIAFTAILLLWSGASWADYPVINIDGDISDWTGLQPAFVDEVDDENPNADFEGTDIKELYLARDGTYLYIMVKLHDGNPKSDVATQYIFETIQVGCAVQPGDRLAVAHSYNPNFWLAFSYERAEGGGSVIANYDDSYVGTGPNCLEWKVPLSDIGDLSNRYIRVYIHVDGEDPSDDNITNIPIEFDQNGIFIGQAIPGIKSHYLQNRSFEDGRSKNKLYFTLKDEHCNEIQEDVHPVVELYDPVGTQLALSPYNGTSAWDAAWLLSGWYDSNTGQFSYGDSFWIDPAYAYTFSESLVSGQYRLVVTVPGYPSFEFLIDYDGSIEIPCISADSFHVRFDGDGNLLWSWKPPQSIDPSLSTSLRAFIGTISGGSRTDKLLYIKLPSHLGFVFVPADVITSFQGGDETLTFLIGLRRNNNFNRSYSTTIPLSEATGPVQGDINGDKTIDLIEAINALQVTSGAHN
jgi:hypothetical protein